MSKENKLIPELRFPEFVEDGEWEEKKIGEISEIVRGGSPRPIQDYTTTDKNGLNWLKIADVSSDSKYVTGTKERVISEALNSTREVNPGDLILSNSMSFGRPYILKIKTCIHDGWIAIRKISNKTFEDYLFYFISSESSQSYFQINAAGAAVKNLNADIVKLLPIHLPNKLQEQQKIASCLSSLDELIAAHNHKLQALQDHKKGLMQNLFPQEGETVPKYRFPEFREDGAWEEKIIGDFIMSHKGGASLTPSDFVTKSNFEIIPKKAIGAGGWLNIDRPTYCSYEFFNNNEQSIVDNSYLITTLRDLVPSGPNIGYIVKYSDEKKYILAQGVYGIRIKDDLSSDFLIHFSNSNRYRKLVNAIMVGSTQVHIRNGEFFKIPIYVPSTQEQQKIASCLSSLDELITAQAERIEQLKLHKKGLMQGLFPSVTD